MKNIIRFCGPILIAASLAKPAVAQVVGSYAGTSADGQSVSFDVGGDSNTGGLAVTGATINYSAPCRNNSYVLNTDWGLGGIEYPITNNRAAFVDEDNYFKFTISLVFSSDGQSATGFITSVGPTLFPTSGVAKQALICTSPRQAMTLTLLPPGSPAMKANRKSVHSGKVEAAPDSEDAPE